MTKRSGNKKKKPLNPLWIWAALLAVVVVLFTTYLVQRQSPTPDKSVRIRTALVEVCRQIGSNLYPDLSRDLLLNACYQEAIDLYAAQPDVVTSCYDAIMADPSLSWGPCMTSQDADFSGVYLRAAASQSQ